MNKTISLSSKNNECLISCFSDIDGSVSVIIRSTKKYLLVFDEIVYKDRKTLSLNTISNSLREFISLYNPRHVVGNHTSSLICEKLELLDWQESQFDLDKISFLVQSLLNESKLRFTPELKDCWEKEFRNFSLQKAKEGIVNHRLFALFHGICDLQDEEMAWEWLKYL